MIMASGSLPPQFPRDQIGDRMLLGRRHRRQHAAAAMPIDAFSAMTTVDRILVVMNLFPQTGGRSAGPCSTCADRDAPSCSYGNKTATGLSRSRDTINKLRRGDRGARRACRADDANSRAAPASRVLPTTKCRDVRQRSSDRQTKRAGTRCRARAISPWRASMRRHRVQGCRDRRRSRCTMTPARQRCFRDCLRSRDSSAGGHDVGYASPLPAT